MAMLALGAWGQAPSLIGWWLGSLPTPTPLRLELHVTPSGTGFGATFKSIDQGGATFPASRVTVNGQKVTVAVTSLRASFEGELSADGNTLTGTWTQGGGKLPLTLHREVAPFTGERPQEPKPPFPYQVIEAKIPGPGAIELAGTLTVPPGAGQFPAALLISGSGPNTRDENVFGHKIFLVLADYLTRHGFAVLRVDKRGVGESTGNTSTATTEDYAQDAAAEFAWLIHQPRIAAARTGLIGHSEGGLIAAMVASQDPKVGFVVMLAGPGEKGEDVIVSQVKALNAASGIPPAMQDKNAAVERAILNIIMAAPSDAAVPAALAAAEANGEIPKIPPAQIAVLASPWYRSFLNTDPATYLEKLRCPVLALIGSKDVQVPPAANLPLLKTALAHNPHAMVEELPGLNHLFQPATTGLPAEYAQIEETMAPAALEGIARWLQQVTH
jgi:pimeloyl-ACP methyl ester carboxylesterase